MSVGRLTFAISKYKYHCLYGQAVKKIFIFQTETLPGGIQFVLKHIKDEGIDTFIDEQLGSRGAKKEYSISDGLLAIHYSHLCGGSCMEDINTLNEHIGFHPGLSSPSADTSLRVMQELKTENAIVENGDVT